MSHDKNCDCIACQGGMDKLVQWEIENYHKYGWYAHFVGGEQSVNYHTHGLFDKFNHPDLQIVFPLDPKIAMQLFWNCTHHIEAGKRFMPWDTVDQVVARYNVKFIPVWEESSERHVLRIILPDAQGRLDRSNIEGGFAIQYDDIEEAKLPVSLDEMVLASNAEVEKFRNYREISQTLKLSGKQ